MVEESKLKISVNTKELTNIINNNLKIYPLSFAQQRIWFLEKLNPGTPIYNMPSALKWKGKLKINELTKAFKEIINRHEILRTNFTEINGKAIQIVHSDLEKWDIQIVSLMHLKNSLILQKTLDSYINSFIKKPFDLEKDFLFRIELLKINTEEFILLINIHHIIFDGYSSAILFNEFILLYKSYIMEQEFILPPLPMQYGDYAQWQKKILNNDNLINQQMDYWISQLSDISPIILPLDNKRPTTRTYKGDEIKFQLSIELKNKLNKLSNQYNVSLCSVLLATFYTLLFRYNVGEDISIGVPIANRDREELINLIGLFINTLILRVNLTDNPKFADLLKRTQHSILDAQENKDVPFEYLVNKLINTRDLNTTPLTQIMFVFESIENIVDQNIGNIIVSSYPVVTKTAKFDLTLNISVNNLSIDGSFEYSDDIFNKETIDQFIKHYIKLLDQVVKDPCREIAYFELLSQEEIKQLTDFYSINVQNVSNFSNNTIHGMFEQTVKKFPDKIATCYNKEEVTYDYLNKEANKLAYLLLQKNIKNDSVVAICLKRSINSIIAILGVLKVGGTYLPLEANTPKNRLEHLLIKSRAEQLIIDSTTEENFTITGVGYINIDKIKSSLKEQSENNLDLNVAISSNAYIIYTSGTTGDPKGVQISHFNLMRLFEFTNSMFLFNPEDTWTLFHSFAFDFSVWEMWGALLYGGKLIIVPHYISRSPQRFYDMVSDEKVTVLNLTPSAFTLFSDTDNSCSNSNLVIREIIFGGEKLNFDILRNWIEKNGIKETRLTNMYGITECTIHLTYYPIQKQDILTLKSIIGRPIPDMKIYVLDKYLNLLPKGAIGEFYVSGSGVSKGYLHDKKLTEEKFIISNSKDINKQRFYKTGDVGRICYNNNYEYLGRIDNQVKIRGFRIELSEIEAKINSFPDVILSVVLINKCAENRDVISAYIVSKKMGRFFLNSLFTFLETNLPTYMLPSAFAIISDLPMTINGKIDYKVLRSKPTKVIHNINFQEPKTKKEKILADIWKQVLKIEKVSTNDNFFTLGGDSISILQVIAKARKRKLYFEVQDIYKYQTIAKLLKNLKNNITIVKKEDEFISNNSVVALSHNIEDFYPLTSMQQGMIYHTELDPHSVIFHDIVSFSIAVDTSKVNFTRIINNIVQKHPVLRTSIDFENYQIPTQIVHKVVTPFILVTDISQYAKEQQNEYIRSWVEQEKKSKFNLNTPHLIRFVIHILDSYNINFSMSFHHLILDGWSVSKLITEIVNGFIYGKENNQDKNLQVHNSFKDYALKEKAVMEDNTYANFWKTHLNEISIKKLPRWPIKFRNRNAASMRCQELSKQLSNELSISLHQIANRAEVPIKSVLFTAHIAVMSMLLNSDDLVTGLVTNVRPTDDDIDNSLGLYLNILPFRIKCKKCNWLELIKQVYQIESEIYAYRLLPIQHIGNLLKNNNLFEVIFNYMHFYAYKNVDKKKLECVSQFSFYEETNFPLVVNFSKGHSSSLITLSLSYYSDNFCSEQIELILGYYLRTLESITETPTYQHNTSILISDNEFQRFCIDKNFNNWTDYPKISVVEQFLEHVSVQPDFVVLKDRNSNLTYFELDNASSYIASILKKRFTKNLKGQIIGLLMEPCINQVVSLLGIVKTGAAYLPISIEDPLVRINRIISESQPIAILMLNSSLASQLNLANNISIEIIYINLPISEAYNSSAVTDNISSTETDLLYVTYTSGTTGIPKGVMIEQKGITRLVKNTNYVTITNNDCITYLSNISFDLSAFEIWGAILNGACLVILNKATILNIKKMNFILKAYHVSIMWLTSSLFNEIVLSKEVDFSSVKYLLVGGEKLNHRVIEEFFLNKTKLPQFFLNGYGPTENSVFSATYCINRSDDLSETVPIGKFISNSIGYVLDNNLRPTPLGCVGELYVGGAGLSIGYLRNEQLNKKSFITNPYIQYLSSNMSLYTKLYKTGDLVRWLPDDNLDYIGRIDNQVKIRGYRVELEEIESAILSHSSIKEVVVLVKYMDNLDIITAYCVLNSTLDSITAEDLTNYLSTILPIYMIPGSINFISQFPLTPNGKIDKVSLINLIQTNSSSIEISGSLDEIESHIYYILKDLLNLEHIDVNRSFLLLGLHSLLATRMIPRLSRIFSIHLDLYDIFRYNTIKSLANFIRPLVAHKSNQNDEDNSKEEDMIEVIL